MNNFVSLSKFISQKTLKFIRNILNPFFNFREVSILCYHSISDDQSETSVSEGSFERHIKTLKKFGYTFVSLADIFAWLSQGMPLPRKAVAITFDDGYADFKTTALPILERYKVPATVFIVGEREQYRLSLGTDLAMLSDEDVAELKKNPLVEVGWHTHTHPNLKELSAGDTKKECTPPHPMRFFAYPGGNYSESAIDLVQKVGFSAAFSIKRDLVRLSANRWLIPRLVILKSNSAGDLVFFVSTAQHWFSVMRKWLKYHV